MTGFEPEAVRPTVALLAKSDSRWSPLLIGLRFIVGFQPTVGRATLTAVMRREPMAKKTAKRKTIKAKGTTRGKLVPGAKKKSVKKAPAKKPVEKKAALKKVRSKGAKKVVAKLARAKTPVASKRFQPPPLDTLASIDMAKCRYPAELAEIVGVVSFGGQGGWETKTNYHVHCFSFAAWRRTGQPLVTTTLTLLRPVAPKSDWFSAYPEGSIHKVRVLLSVDETRAILSESLKANARDAELKSVAKELQKPVVIETERFGPLTLDRRIDWFQGETTWNGIPIRIRFEAGNNLALTPLLKTAECLFADSLRWGKAVNDFAVKEKLDLANDWNEEDPTPITAEDFLNRMSLRSISIGPDGEFDFWHDDGDLFWGHSIQISGSLTKGVTRSDIPG